MRAPSAEEHEEEALTAKKAKHEEQIRVRARDGEEVTLSRDAARLMGTLNDLMDLATSEDGIYPMPTIMASTLQMVCNLNDPDYTWPSSDELSLFQLIQLIEDALYISTPPSRSSTSPARSPALTSCDTLCENAATPAPFAFCKNPSGEGRGTTKANPRSVARLLTFSHFHYFCAVSSVFPTGPTMLPARGSLAASLCRRAARSPRPSRPRRAGARMA